MQDMLLLEQHGLLTRAAAQLAAFCDTVLLLKARKASPVLGSTDAQMSGFHDASHHANEITQFSTGL